ncbi:hypothetical protein HY640_05040 [Candidatus Woesearchaeota archaeon]|nr:hypothetical protein [Candidatus Woesearchaeota archaeon]
MSFNVFFRGFRAGLHDFGSCISTIVNSVLLAVAYVAGVGVTSIVAKVVGKRFLDSGFSDAPSYWVDLRIDERPDEDFYRQF